MTVFWHFKIFLIHSFCCCFSFLAYESIAVLSIPITNERLDIMKYTEPKETLKIFENKKYSLKMPTSDVQATISNTTQCSTLQELDLNSLSLNSDTLTHDDAVRKHYTSLPYPAISHDDLKAEYNHYRRCREKGKIIPYNPTSAIDLESLNHFLFHGKETFRYIYIRF